MAFGHYIRAKYGSAVEVFLGNRHNKMNAIYQKCIEAIYSENRQTIITNDVDDKQAAQDLNRHESMMNCQMPREIKEGVAPLFGTSELHHQPQCWVIRQSTEGIFTMYSKPFSHPKSGLRYF
jgi:hypothetical protein